MSLKLGCIADDYTGASDLANMVQTNGLATVQTIGVPSPALRAALGQTEALVIALKIRSVPAQEAVAKARAAADFLRQQGASHILYKICSTFDSTDTGNIGPVLEALSLPGESVIVTPAFPQTGRTVYKGHLFVNGVPLHESPLKDHPLNPMHDSNLVRVLARQSTAPVGLLDWDKLTKGPDEAEAYLASLAAQGVRAVICDVVSAADLEILGKIAARSRFSVGASGLGLGLARALRDPNAQGHPYPQGHPYSQGHPYPAGEGRIIQTRQANPPQVKRGEAPSPPSAQAPAKTQAPAPAQAAIPFPRSACLAGSCSAATLRQIAVAEASMPVLWLDPQALLPQALLPQALAGETLLTLLPETARVLALAAKHLLQGPVLIAASQPPDQVRALQARYGREATGAAIEHALAGLAEGLVALGVRHLVVAGGETSGAVVDRLGLEAFRLGAEIAPGVPVMTTLGARHAGLKVALKSGNFGGETFFTDALAHLHAPL